jgi:TolB-like protein
VLIGYGVVSFAVLQVVEPIQHALGMPDSVLKLVVVLLGLGFPIAVVLAWAFDVNAAGIERAAPAAHGSPWLRGPRLALVLAGIGALAAAPGVAWYLFVRGRSQPTSAATDGALKAKLDAVPPATDIRAAPSIAVLPLVNMSSDKEQEYFSDGLSEELLNLLAQVPGLQVAARTSAFAFKGRNVKMSEIGRELGVATVLEGSVRKSGQQVRITTQLINAADGYHLWSETYDRKLTEVFAVQDEIARAVVAALKLKLLPPQVEPRKVNPEAHDQYLLGRHFYQRSSPEGFTRAIEALEKAVALDPAYAPAWAALAWSRYWATDRDPVHNPPDRLVPAAKEAADKAIALGPDLPDGWVARGGIRTNFSKDWAGARTDLERALALSPGDSGALVYYARLVATLGQLPQAIAAGRKAVLVDPLNAGGWFNLSNFYLGTGEFGLAQASAAHTVEIAPEHMGGLRNLVFAYVLQNRLPEARAASHRAKDDGSSGSLVLMLGDALVEQGLGHEAESRRIADEYAANPSSIGASYQIAEVFAWQGRTGRAFDWLGHAYDEHDAGLSYVKYDPFLSKLRGDPRYPALLKKLHLPLD